MKMYRELTSRKYYKYLSHTFVPSTTLQSFTVPSTTTKLIVDCVASKGADATGAGGNGGRVQCTLPVTPSSTLYFYVGAIPADPHVAAYNASDIRTDNTDVLDSTSLSSRLVVAGAGGSGGSSTASYAGGNGGGLIGADGGGPSSVNGKGGTQSAGGTGTATASNGSFGIGGNAYTASSGSAGGAGWYGGGGSRTTGGAGGGSSYTDPSCTYITHTQGYNNGVGYIKITYVVQSTPYEYDYYVDEATYKAKNSSIAGNAIFYTPGSLEKGQYRNPIRPVGYTVVGSPTVTNGVASGFTNSNYLVTPISADFKDVTGFIIKIKPTTANTSVAQYVFSGLGTVGSNAAYIRISQSNIYFTSRSTDATFVSNYVLNTWYWLKYTNDGTEQKFYYSTDGINYTLSATRNIQYVDNGDTRPLYFGRTSWGSGDEYSFAGEIDLKNTVFQINHFVWFRGDMPNGTYT